MQGAEPTTMPLRLRYKTFTDQASSIGEVRLISNRSETKQRLTTVWIQDGREISLKVSIHQGTECPQKLHLGLKTMGEGMDVRNNLILLVKDITKL